VGIGGIGVPTGKQSTKLVCQEQERDGK